MPSARPTKMSRRPKSSGFSASAPIAAVPTLATANPAPSEDKPVASAAPSSHQLQASAPRPPGAPGVAAALAAGADTSSAVAASESTAATTTSAATNREGVVIYDSCVVEGGAGSGRNIRPSAVRNRVKNSK